MDFLSANNANLEGIPDPEILALAAEEKRILVSHDFKTMPRHLGEFLEASGFSPGVFLVSQHTPIAEVIDAMILVWMASDAEEWENQILEIPF